MNVKDINLIIYYLTEQLDNFPNTYGMKDEYKKEIENKKDNINYLIQTLEDSEIK